MIADSRPRILLSAYQCGPGMGSVSQIGWEWFRRVSQREPTTLFTHVRNREALEGAGGAPPGSEIVYIDTEWFAGPLYRAARRIFPGSEHAVFLVSSLDFFPYDAMVVREARRRKKAGTTWCVAHQVTPVSPVAPTRLHRVGAPVLIGPMNGGLENPRQFPNVMKEEGRWIYPVRHLARILDAVWGSTRNASVLLTATAATRDAIPERYRRLCVPLVENGIDPARFRAAPWPDPPSVDVPLRILFVGRLVAVKGLPMLLAALARVRTKQPVQLAVVGDGPMRDAWEREAQVEGLADIVTFLGERSLDEVAAEMRRAHVFCLPSVRESGGAVLLEAMASARPILTVAYGGPAEIVCDAVGRGIEPNGPDYVTERLGEALLDVAANPDEWRRKGEEGCRIAAARYSWDAKVDEAMGLYARLRAGGVEGLERGLESERARPLGSGA